ncbi:MAG: AAA family ATPase [Ketobacteraceae bacterium]|nr:AAA family ATPase [Ketobacteraceae bacterium]
MSETHTERLNTERFKAALNIDREPFSDEGVAGLFFPGGGRQELVDQLMHLCRYGPPLLVLLGDNGVGKSTVVRQMESRIDPSVFQCLHIEADVLADENLILQRIAEGFHLDFGFDKDAAIESLVRYSRELDGYSQTPLLVLDEAQNLSLSAIEFLIRLLGHSARSGLRCLLVMDGTDPEKIPLLAPVLKSDLDSEFLEVPPLDPDAIEEYLDYRMTTSGLSDIRFSPDQKRKIVNRSMGNIDRLNMVSRQILVEHFPYEKNRKKPVRLPFLHAAVVTLLAALLLTAYWYVPDFTGSEPPVLAESGGEVSNAPEKRGIGVSDYPAPEREAAEESGRGDQAPATAENTPEAPVGASPGEDSSAAAEALDSFETDKEAVDFNYSETDPAEEALQPVASRTSQAAEPRQTQTAPPVTAEKAKPAEGEAAQKPAAVQVAAADTLSPREKWLMSLDKNKFTLQMLGAREEASVQKFLAKYPSLKDIAYYRTTHRDQDWYVVVYGLFGSKESAKQALSKLPKPLRESSPWARSVASVQEEIQKRQ